MLAKELQVNRSTIVGAYEELKSLGVVERQREAEHGSIRTYGVSHINEYRTGVGTWRMDGFLPNVPLVQQIRTETQKMI